METPHRKWMMTGGPPVTQETSISIDLKGWIFMDCPYASSARSEVNHLQIHALIYRSRHERLPPKKKILDMNMMNNG